MKYIIFFSLALIGLTSCSLFEKSMQKSERKGPSQADSPLNASSPIQSTELKQQIKDLEKRLETKKEKEQYSKILPWVKDDSERVDFLMQANLEKRNQWIQEKKIFSRSQSPSPEMKKLIDNQDIALGMPMDYVVKSWGEPTSKEVSGNPLNRNERWRYIRTLTSPEGFRQEKRYVYFESGKVVGWETE